MATRTPGLVAWRNLDNTLGQDCLRIASYNIHRCVGRDGRADPGRVAQVILELGCDAVGLQDVRTRARSPGRVR